MNITEIREAIRSAFRGKPVSRVDLFGSAARGEMTPESDVDILVTPEATCRDLFVMAADVEDAVGRRVDFLIRADVEAMKNCEARDLILKSAVPVYVAAVAGPLIVLAATAWRGFCKELQAITFKAAFPNT